MRKFLVCFILMCAVLSGCGQKQKATETKLQIEKDGKITSVLVETFDKDFYNQDELLEMINLEIAQYNQKAGTQAIVLESLTVDELKRAIAVMEYQSDADYAAYNEVPFFTGTVKEARQEGVNLDVVLTEAGKESTIDKKEIEQLEAYHLVVWYGDMPVRVPGKIRYHGEGVRLLGSKQAIAEIATVGEALADQEWEDMKQDGPFYLLYK